MSISEQASGSDKVVSDKPTWELASSSAKGMSDKSLKSTSDSDNKLADVDNKEKVKLHDPTGQYANG